MCGKSAIFGIWLGLWATATHAEHWVSVGSYQSSERARQDITRLERQLGLTLTSREAIVKGALHTRVLAGPVSDRREAENLLDAVRARGIADAWIWFVANPAEVQLSEASPVEPEDPSFESAPIADRVPSRESAVVDTAPKGYVLNKLRVVQRDNKEMSRGRRFDTDFSARLKLFSTASFLPDHDAQRQAQGTPALDHSADLRLMLKQDLGPFRLVVDHSTVALNGDGIALNVGRDSAVDQTVTDDRNRRWDWTRKIDNGTRHQSFHRLDRLALKWQSSQWGVTLGREAVSWGNGIVFQPMDIFSPFSPTVVDRDYKAGDDLVLIDRLIGNGMDLQLLHVARRDEAGKSGHDVSSSALKWHGYAGPIEFDVVAAQHFDQDIYAAATRFPVGPALVRLDLVASEDLAGDQVFSGVLNADVSFMLADRNAYAFIEYFHNGWGVTDLPDDAASLPVDLQLRIARGELFNLMKNYVAAGFNYEWHPLIAHNASIIANLHDNSMLLQTSLSYSPGDNQLLQMGLIEPLGDAGDEFGGVPLAGRGLTTGGASRAYFRWVYYL